MEDQHLNPSDLICVGNTLSHKRSDWRYGEFLNITDDDKIVIREGQLEFKYCFPFYELDHLKSDKKVILEAKNGLLKYAE